MRPPSATIRHKCLSLLFVFAMSAGVNVATADVRFVDDDAALGGDGASWSTAYRYLQDALTESRSNSAITEIRIGGGEYRPDLDEAGIVAEHDRAASFVLDRPLALRGGFGGLLFGNEEDRNHQDPQAFESILLGDLLGEDLPNFVNRTDNSTYVVRVGTNDTISWTLIQGLTVQGGETNGPNGGGIRLASGALRMDALVIKDNRGVTGGGFEANAGTQFELLNSTVAGNRTTISIIPGQGLRIGRGGGLFAQDVANGLVEECVFAANHSRGYGGGAYIDGATQIRFERCTFRENTTSNDGISAIPESGGAIYFSGESPQYAQFRVVDCEFSENVSPSGAAISMIDGTVQIVGCRFYGNVAPEGLFSLLSVGAGVRSYDGVHTIVNCLFSGNRGRLGSAVYRRTIFPSIALVLVNSTIVDNYDVASYSTGATVYSVATVYLRVMNCIIRDNELQPFVPGSATPVMYSNIEGGWPGVGNIDVDPGFINPLGPDGVPDTGDEDFRLGVASPCIDAGSNGALPLDVLDLDADGDTGEAIPIDLAELPRQVDIPGVVDTGSGAPPIVDIGAYEFQREGDANDDGNVDESDFEQFGLCMTGPTPGPGQECQDACCGWFDVDGDMDIDFFDYAALMLQMD